MTSRWSNGKMKVQRKSSKRQPWNSIERSSTCFSALYVCCYFPISNSTKFARGNGKSWSSSLKIHLTNRFDGSTSCVSLRISLHRSVLGCRSFVSPSSRRCHWINSLCTDLRFHPQQFSSLSKKSRFIVSKIFVFVSKDLRIDPTEANPFVAFVKIRSFICRRRFQKANDFHRRNSVAQIDKWEETSRWEFDPFDSNRNDRKMFEKSIVKRFTELDHAHLGTNQQWQNTDRRISCRTNVQTID